MGAAGKRVLPVVNLQEFFKDALHGALVNQHVAVEDHTEHYDRHHGQPQRASQPLLVARRQGEEQRQQIHDGDGPKGQTRGVGQFAEGVEHERNSERDDQHHEPPKIEPDGSDLQECTAHFLI